MVGADFSLDPEERTPTPTPTPRYPSHEESHSIELAPVCGRSLRPFHFPLGWFSFYPASARTVCETLLTSHNHKSNPLSPFPLPHPPFPHLIFIQLGPWVVELNSAYFCLIRFEINTRTLAHVGVPSESLFVLWALLLATPTNQEPRAAPSRGPRLNFLKASRSRPSPHQMKRHDRDKHAQKAPRSG